MAGCSRGRRNLSQSRDTRKLVDMRDRETIDAELRRIALSRRSSGQGGQLSSREADELLDELLAHSGRGPLPDLARTPEAVVVPRDRGVAVPKSPRRRAGALSRLSLLAAVPLSLAAVAVAVVMMVSVRHEDSSAQPSEAQPSDTPSATAAPPSRAAPRAPAPRLQIADAAFVGALRREGVPVPSQEYVMAQGHAVCDFLAHQPNFADAAGFVQRSSVWDADQSAKVTAGAIVSYCPQSQSAMVDQSQPAYQSTLSDLQAIQQQLQGIQGDLHGIEGSLNGLPGRP